MNTPDMLDEMEWERGMMLAAQHAHADKPAEGAYGVAEQSVLGRALPRAIEAVEALRASLVTSQGAASVRGPILMLPGDTSALLTLRCMWDATPIITGTATAKGRGMHYLVRTVGEAVVTELNLRHWLATSKASARAWAKERGLATTPRSIAERLISERKVNRRSLTRWRKSFAELTHYDYTNAEKTHIGDLLVNAIVTELCEFFRIDYGMYKGRTEKRLATTEAFQDEVRIARDKHHFSLTLRLPMIVPPVPWRVSCHMPREAANVGRLRCASGADATDVGL